MPKLGVLVSGPSYLAEKENERKTPCLKFAIVRQQQPDLMADTIEYNLGSEENHIWDIMGYIMIYRYSYMGYIMIYNDIANTMANAVAAQHMKI